MTGLAASVRGGGEGGPESFRHDTAGGAEAFREHFGDALILECGGRVFCFVTLFGRDGTSGGGGSFLLVVYSMILSLAPGRVNVGPQKSPTSISLLFLLR